MLLNSGWNRNYETICPEFYQKWLLLPQVNISVCKWLFQLDDEPKMVGNHQKWWLLPSLYMAYYGFLKGVPFSSLPPCSPPGVREAIAQGRLGWLRVRTTMDVEVVGWLVLYSWLVLVDGLYSWLVLVDGMLWLDVDWIYYSLRPVSQTKTIKVIVCLGIVDEINPY